MPMRVWLDQEQSQKLGSLRASRSVLEACLPPLDAMLGAAVMRLNLVHSPAICVLFVLALRTQLHVLYFFSFWRLLCQILPPI